MPPSRRFCTSSWIKRDKEFIDLLKHYEEIDAFHKNYSKDSPFWKEISRKVDMPAAYCRTKWLGIKYKYLKLKNMIKIGKVTEDRVRMNPKTSKYLDGRLDFLDRYLSVLPDKALPLSVHRFFASSFGEESNTTTQNVDAVKLIKLEKNGSGLQVIEDYKQDTGTEPTCILPNTEQAMEEECTIYDDSNDVELVGLAPLHQIILPTIQLHQHNPIGDMDDFQYVTSKSKKPAKKKESKIKKKIPDCKLANFLVKYSTTDIETNEGGDLKEYMDDLAEVLCNRLALYKRKYFLSQIDLIVSEILEGA